MTPNPKNKQHHWIATVRVIYADAEENFGMKEINTFIVRPAKYLPMKSFVECQETVQYQLIQHGLRQESIREVIVTSVSYIGLMSQAEFLEGMEDNKEDVSSGAQAPQPTVVTRKKGETDEEASKRLNELFFPKGKTH